MEIEPVPHRSTRGDWRKLALAVLVLAPVVLLLLLPAALGLDRSIVADRSMDGSTGRGSIVLARDVPAGDLRVGDVITVPTPEPGTEERTYRRIVALRDDVATVAADGDGARRETVPLTDGSYSRVSVGVPWIGYPFLVQGGWAALVAVALAALFLALAKTRRSPPRAVGRPRTRLSVG